jgi:hypothetical protein
VLDQSAGKLLHNATIGGQSRRSQLWVTCGRRLGKDFLTFSSWSGAVTCPACWCGMVAAGPNALRDLLSLIFVSRIVAGMQIFKAQWTRLLLE